MSREDAQVNFRMPHALKHQLVQAAHHNHRSLTAEIVSRLEESFAREARPETRDPQAESVERALREILADIESGAMVLRTKRRP